MWEDKVSFCPLCGSSLDTQDLHGRPRPACTSCEFIWFRNPVPASAAVILREPAEGPPEVLLIRRRIPPFQGHWTLPAGYQEYDESGEEAAVREVLEETGLVVEVEALVMMLYTVDDPRKRANLAVYRCRQVVGEPQAGSDAMEVGYFPLDALPPQIGFENNRKVLEHLRKQYLLGA